MDEGIYDLDQNKISNDKITQRENITQEGYVLDGREKIQMKRVHLPNSL